MPRRQRSFVEGLSLHVHNRGNNSVDMFHDDVDRTVFLLALGAACRQYDVDVHAWMLMDNHFHLIVTPHAPAGVPCAMQQVGRCYVPYFNRRAGRTGGLFEGRYSAHLMDTEVYWYRCLRYVELNRVRAGLVAAPEDYPWSSYRAHAFGTHDAVLTEHPLYLALGSGPRTDKPHIEPSAARR